MRLIKFALALVALVTGASAIYAWSHFRSCEGRLQACYASYRDAVSGTDRITAQRRNAIYGGFTASTSLVAFQIPLGDGTDGIIVIDRRSKQARIISALGYTHWSPRFSRDGTRFVFGRRKVQTKEGELVSCNVGAWNCATMVRAANPLISPIDIGEGEIVFSSSRAIVREDKTVRFPFKDFFLARKGERPRQLTNFQVAELGSISASGDKLVFSAVSTRGFEPRSCSSVINCDLSDIYALEFDLTTMTIVNPPPALKPLFTIPGLSTKPEVSADGKRIAFLNTNRNVGQYRYNMILATIDGTVLRTTPVEGFALSTAAFVGDTVLFNELFDDRYRISYVDSTMNRTETFSINHSPEYLQTLERIALSIDPSAMGL